MSDRALIVAIVLLFLASATGQVSLWAEHATGDGTVISGAAGHGAAAAAMPVDDEPGPGHAVYACKDVSHAGCSLEVGACVPVAASARTAPRCGTLAAARLPLVPANTEDILRPPIMGS